MNRQTGVFTTGGMACINLDRRPPAFAHLFAAESKRRDASPRYAFCIKPANHLLPHPLPPRPHDGDDDDQHDEDAHQHDPVRGAGDGVISLEQARQAESALVSENEERSESQVHGMNSNVKYITRNVTFIA